LIQKNAVLIPPAHSARDRAPPSSPRSFNPHDHLDFHSRVAGKRGHAYGETRVFADRLAQDFHHQIGKSIYHARLAAKTLRKAKFMLPWSYATV
jgi:hypothetical protein